MSTPHNGANYGDIAETVLMPGDPLRAKWIAETYLDNAKCFNTVRNMFGYTGTYNGKEISVMGHGMGIPSIALYSYELYDMYGVENIIRIGSAGAYSDDIMLGDLIFAMGASTDSNFAAQYRLPGTLATVADYSLLRRAIDVAEKKGLKYHCGNVLSSDHFYDDDNAVPEMWKKMGVLAVEMEAAGLYLNAARLRKKALCILTASDHLFRAEHLDTDARRTSFGDMIEVALDAFA